MDRFMGMPAPGHLVLMPEMNYRTRTVETVTVGSYEFPCERCGGDVWGTVHVRGSHGRLTARGVSCSECTATYTIEIEQK